MEKLRFLGGILWLVFVTLVQIILKGISLAFLAIREVGPIIFRSLMKAIGNLVVRSLAAIFTTRGAIALLGGWFIGSAWFYLPEAKYAFGMMFVAVIIIATFKELGLGGRSG